MRPVRKVPIISVALGRDRIPEAELRCGSDSALDCTEPSYKSSSNAVFIRSQTPSSSALVRGLRGLARGFRCVVHPSDLGHFGLWICHRITLGISHCAAGADAHISAIAVLARQVDELLGVLRGVKQVAQLPDLLAAHELVGVLGHRLIPLGGVSCIDGPPGLPGLLVLTRFLASAMATSRVMPNTANVLIFISICPSDGRISFSVGGKALWKRGLPD